MPAFAPCFAAWPPAVPYRAAFCRMAGAVPCPARLCCIVPRLPVHIAPCRHRAVSVSCPVRAAHCPSPLCRSAPGLVPFALPCRVSASLPQPASLRCARRAIPHFRCPPWRAVSRRIRVMPPFVPHIALLRSAVPAVPQLAALPRAPALCFALPRSVSASLPQPASLRCARRAIPHFSVPAVPSRIAPYPCHAPVLAAHCLAALCRARRASACCAVRASRPCSVLRPAPQRLSFPASLRCARRAIPHFSVPAVPSRIAP
jgi:hypothetical protein